MTKLHADDFRRRLDAGETPPLPRKLEKCLFLTREQIQQSITDARRGDYGTGHLLAACRLVRMGLFDDSWRPTAAGLRYRVMIASRNI